MAARDDYADRLMTLRRPNVADGTTDVREFVAIEALDEIDRLRAALIRAGLDYLYEPDAL